MEKTVTDAIHYRRSVRVYKDTPIDTEKVKQCLKNEGLSDVFINYMDRWPGFAKK